MEIKNKNIKERRQHYRIQVADTHCVVFKPPAMYEGFKYKLKELSPTGTFVEGLTDAAIGSIVKILFQIDGSSLKLGGLMLDAKVIYTLWDNHKDKNKLLGTGLMFLNISAEEAKLLEEHCNSLRENLIKEAICIIMRDMIF